MKLKELIEINVRQHYSQWCLIVQKQVKDERSPFTHDIYDDNYSILSHTDIMKCLSNNEFANYIVLIPYFRPIDIGRNYKHWKYLNTIVITTYDELLKRYSKTQLDHWLIWLDNEVRKEVAIKDKYCL